jgi:hypothetical protein
MKAKINDNKTIREQSSKILIEAVLQIDTKTLSRLQKNLLFEVLVRGKSFFELSEQFNLSTYRQREVFKGAVNELNRYLKEINDNQRKREEEQKELADLRNWKKILEANVVKEQEIDPNLKKVLSLSIQQLAFSARVKQICFNENISLVSDLVRYSKRKISRLRNCGKKSLAEMDKFISENGLYWGMKV